MSQEEREKFAVAVRSLYAVMLSSLPVWVLVPAIRAGETGGGGAPPGAQPLFVVAGNPPVWLLVGGAVVALGASWYLRNLLFVRLRARATAPRARQTAFLLSRIVSFVLLELASMLGMLLSLMTGDIGWALALVLTAIGVGIAGFPKGSEIAALDT